MINSLIWFRQDLRISDNPALINAIKNSETVTAIYIYDDSKNIRQLGGASKWWLYYALKDLEKSLKEKYNITLIYRKGSPSKIFEEIIDKVKISNIYWNRLYEPYHTERDEKIKSALKNKNIEVESFNASLLAEPWEVKNGSGNYFKVYTAFYESSLKNHKPREVLKAPNKQDKVLKIKVPSDNLEDWGLRPIKPNWAKPFYPYWKISEEAAQDRLYDFLENAIANYSDNRNFPDIEGTSKLSPYLHFGQISPHQILSVCNFHKETKGIEGIDKYISEVYWREFSYSLMFNFKHMDTKNFRPEFDNFPWDNNDKTLRAWQKGEAGYPIVDAGMRELWSTGWMHNRVRMIVGSLLTKHLLTHWSQGEEWFWNTLVDADLANNSASWQWIAGSGADASPYFRIFNPITQGEKFDPKGNYIRKWVPELKNVPDEYIHKPWEAPLLHNYVKPVISHEQGRNKALESYKKMRNQ